MGYQRISSGGNVLEQKDGEFYINGVDIKTGSIMLKYRIKYLMLGTIFGVLSMATGFIFCSL